MILMIDVFFHYVVFNSNMCRNELIFRDMAAQSETLGDCVKILIFAS